MTIICFFIGHHFVGNGTILFGMIPATPVCERCGKYASGEKTKTPEDQKES